MTKTRNTNVTEDSMRIRSRYLRRLGVVSDSPTTRTPKRTNIRRRPSWSSTSTTESLRDDSDLSDDLSSMGTIQSPPSHGVDKKKSSVQFENTIIVHQIPSCREYSDRLKQLLYIQPLEMQQMAERNYIEFLSEGWNWQQVLEEDQFFHHQDELIHPVHHPGCFNLQSQFCMILKAQQAQ